METHELPDDVSLDYWTRWEQAVRRLQHSEDPVPDEIDGDLDGEPVVDRPATRFEGLRRWVRRHPFVTAFATTSVFVTLGVLVAAQRVVGEHSDEVLRARELRRRVGLEADADEAVRARRRFEDSWSDLTGEGRLHSMGR